MIWEKLETESTKSCSSCENPFFICLKYSTCVYCDIYIYIYIIETLLLFALLLSSSFQSIFKTRKLNTKFEMDKAIRRDPTTMLLQVLALTAFNFKRKAHYINISLMYILLHILVVDHAGPNID
jgi:hypothetical protein